MGYGRGCAIAAATQLLGSSGFMLLAPGIWYQTVPGVSHAVPFNPHFITDIALAYLVSGFGLPAAVALGDRRLAWAASAWPLLHAGFHARLWLTHGLPPGAALPTEIFRVLGTGLLPALGASGLRQARPPSEGDIA